LMMVTTNLSFPLSLPFRLCALRDGLRLHPVPGRDREGHQAGHRAWIPRIPVIPQQRDPVAHPLHARPRCRYVWEDFAFSGCLTDIYVVHAQVSGIRSTRCWRTNGPIGRSD
jgi:hypothetical protein